MTQAGPITWAVGGWSDLGRDGVPGAVLRGDAAGNWTTVYTTTAGPLYSVAFADDNEGWAVGAGIEGRSPQLVHYAGGRWTAVPAPALARAGGARSVALTVAGTGWAVGDSGVNLRLEQGQWQVGPGPSGASLRAVVVDGDGAWAVTAETGPGPASCTNGSGRAGP